MDWDIAHCFRDWDIGPTSLPEMEGREVELPWSFSGDSHGPSIVTKEEKGVIVQISYPSSPVLRFDVAAEARNQREQTKERLERQKASLNTFRRTTRQRTVLKSSAPSPAPAAAQLTEFEIALRTAVANSALFNELMANAPFKTDK